MICRGCEADLSEDQFNWKIKSKGIRHTKCKRCTRAEVNAHYQKNKQYYIEKSMKRSVLIREKYREYKKTLICSECDFSDWRALTFHHRQLSQKDMEVSIMANRGYGWKRIMKEIAKCDVLCFNCHAIKHARVAQMDERRSSKPEVMQVRVLSRAP